MANATTMNDENILEEIKKLYAQPLTEKNYEDIQYALTELYSQLSYSRPYRPRELFLNLDKTFKLTPEIEATAQKIEYNANRPWSADGSGEGNDYFSCMEKLEKITGQTFPRDYIYPNNLTSKEFQKSFNPTRMNKDISTAYHMMAFYGLMNNASGACSHMLFVEKNLAENAERINKSYEDFWSANKNINGFDYLKNINEFSKKREFLMGIASEIPLADIESYLKNAFDNIQQPELEINAKKFDNIFHCGIPFTMTNTTWERFVEPAARQKLLENGLEEIGLSKDDLSKTRDYRSGEVSDKHKKTAESQTEDTKWPILQAKQQRGR